MTSFTKLASRLDVIVKKRTEAAVEARFSELKSTFINTVRLWKMEVRMLLSTPHREGVTNISKYPQMRTGDLRKSLYYKTRVGVKKKTPKAISMSIDIDWDNNPHGTFDGYDYGEKLNSSKKYIGRSFYGWKDRTYELLRKRLRDSIK